MTQLAPENRTDRKHQIVVTQLAPESDADDDANDPTCSGKMAF